MSEKITIAEKAREAKRLNSGSKTQRLNSSQSSNSPAEHILFLQRTIGNREVRRLFKSGVVQARLKIGRPNDMYEQEADRIAEQVMRMPEPHSSNGKGERANVKGEKVKSSCDQNQIMRVSESSCPECPERKEEEEMVRPKPIAEQITPLVQRQVEPEEEEEESLQAKEFGGNAPEIAPDLETRLQSIRGEGQPLDAATRAFFEPRFGYDFSHVRVHADTNATLLARSVNTHAFTVGRNVVFGTSQYTPETTGGKRLLAHELTHVVQQDGKASVPIIQRREEPGTPVPPTGSTSALASATRPSTGRPSPDTRTGHDVYVIDFGVNRDVVNWREAILHIGEIEAESVDQMVRDVKAKVGDPGTNCIRRLTLDGHGSPGNMSVGDGTGWIEGRNISAGNFRPSLADLTPYFCSGATVVLLGCNVGRGPTGVRFIQALADYWQVNVAAPTGMVRGYGIEGVWVWGLPGQVLPSDLMLIVDQIARILDETTYGDDEEMIFEILEASDARGNIRNVRSELVRQGRWDGLCRDLRDEDSARFNRLFPSEPTPSVRLRHPSEIEIPPPWTSGSGSIF